MSEEEINLEEILKLAIKREASDVHLKAGTVPVIRRHGKLRPLSSRYTALAGHEIDNLAFGIMDEKQKIEFRENKQIDLGYGISGLGRFRVNVFRQRGTTRMVIRNIPFTVPTFQDLNLPIQQMEQITQLERGLVLVTGATGSGKSTTLASIIDAINKEKSRHIVTIEDPIEYLIKDRKSIISQREIGTDSMSFSEAMRSTLRQDPDIILIGEMRDRETMATALTAAETGHLVLSTLHTSDATETVHRILCSFPGDQHMQIRYQLASVLKAVFSLRLAHRADGTGFWPVMEILFNNARVAELIAEPDRTSEISGVIEESQKEWGMQSFDQCLHKLLNRKIISQEEAVRLASHVGNFELRRSGVMSGHREDDWKKSQLEQGETAAWEAVPTLDVERSRVKEIDPKSDVKRKKRGLLGFKKAK